MAGEEYILEELDDEAGGLKKAGTVYDREVMYWAGYIYRYWHYYTNESSREIYKIADAGTMNECWLGFHTLDVEMAYTGKKTKNNPIDTGPVSWYPVGSDRKMAMARD